MFMWTRKEQKAEDKQKKKRKKHVHASFETRTKWHKCKNWLRKRENWQWKNTKNLRTNCSNIWE